MLRTSAKTGPPGRRERIQEGLRPMAGIGSVDMECSKVLVPQEPARPDAFLQSRTVYILCGSPESEVCAERCIVHRQLKEYSVAKAQDAKKETKKKPEKTLKEKRVEKQAKKAAKGG